jgi:hypothetical protein
LDNIIRKGTDKDFTNPDVKIKWIEDFCSTPDGLEMDAEYKRSSHKMRNEEGVKWITQ